MLLLISARTRLFRGPSGQFPRVWSFRLRIRSQVAFVGALSRLGEVVRNHSATVEAQWQVSSKTIGLFHVAASDMNVVT